MPHNFHDINGILLVGIDRHLSVLLPGAPVPFIPIIMVQPKLNFLHPFVLGDKQRSTVFFNGVNAVAHWHRPKFLWPHLGLPPFPFDILMPLHILLGSQICWLPKTDVLAEGEPCTPCAIYGPLSINLDCWDLLNLPSSLVLQPGTVQTSPSLADYMAGLKAVAIDFAMNIAFNLLLRGAGRLLGRAARRASRAWVARAARRGRTSPLDPARIRASIARQAQLRARRAQLMAERGYVNTLPVPHSNQGAMPTCGFHTCQNLMGYRDPSRAVGWEDLWRQARDNRWTLRGKRHPHGSGVTIYNQARLANQNGFAAGGSERSWDEIKGLVNAGNPVGAAVPIDQAGRLEPGGSGWHAVIVKGHFQHGGTEYVAVTHPWPDAQTVVWEADAFNAVRQAYVYWLP